MFALLLTLLPAIPHIVMGVEQMFKHHPAATGAAKKQAATSALADMVNLFGSMTGEPAGTGANSATMAYLDTMIDATVKYFNDNGTFTHAAAS
jgi:hypothetical protein